MGILQQSQFSVDDYHGKSHDQTQSVGTSPVIQDLLTHPVFTRSVTDPVTIPRRVLWPTVKRGCSLGVECLEEAQGRLKGLEASSLHFNHSKRVLAHTHPYFLSCFTRLGAVMSSLDDERPLRSSLQKWTQWVILPIINYIFWYQYGQRQRTDCSAILLAPGTTTTTTAAAEASEAVLCPPSIRLSLIHI